MACHYPPEPPGEIVVAFGYETAQVAAAAVAGIVAVTGYKPVVNIEPVEIETGQQGVALLFDMLSPSLCTETHQRGMMCVLDGFAHHHTGNVGDITAGLPPQDYVEYPYIEWYSEANGRVVLELEKSQVELLTQPIPACESDPISRKEQAENMAGFLCGLASELGISEKQALTTGNTVAVERAKRIIANDKIRGMKLLPKEVREKMPALYSQDGKGGKAIVYTKYFTPSSSWTWLVLEGEPVLDESQNEVDYRFFGLVFGHEREFGYFLLSELEEVRGPMGLPIERAHRWLVSPCHLKMNIAFYRSRGRIRLMASLCR